MTVCPSRSMSRRSGRAIEAVRARRQEVHDADDPVGGTDRRRTNVTPIPLLIGDGDSALPVLDSTRILARSALREAARDNTRRGT